MYSRVANPFDHSPQSTEAGQIVYLFLRTNHTELLHEGMSLLAPAIPIIIISHHWQFISGTTDKIYRFITRIDDDRTSTLECPILGDAKPPN